MKFESRVDRTHKKILHFLIVTRERECKSNVSNCHTFVALKALTELLFLHVKGLEGISIWNTNISEEPKFDPRQSKRLIENTKSNKQLVVVAWLYDLIGPNLSLWVYISIFLSICVFSRSKTLTTHSWVEGGCTIIGHTTFLMLILSHLHNSSELFFIDSKKKSERQQWKSSKKETWQAVTIE